MLRDTLGQTYRKVIFLQAILTAGSTIAAFFVAGSLSALSTFLGGTAVLMGSVAYAVLARESRVTAISSGRVFGRHLLAELAKMLVILSLLLLLLATGSFVTGWLVAAAGVALLGHWLALLIIR